MATPASRRQTSQPGEPEAQAAPSRAAPTGLGITNNMAHLRIASRYLDGHGGEIHEALDVRVNPATFSEECGTVEVMRLPPNREVERALEWYQKTNSDVQFDIMNCSWDDLFAQIARARDDHKAQSSKDGHLFRYFWKKAGSKKDVIEPWLQLIPDQYGLSVARGAIGVLFHMAQRSHEKDEQILGAFDDITETMHNAISKNVSFQREPEMHQCCQDLYDCLLKGVADLIWSMEPAQGKNFVERQRQKRARRKNMDMDAMLKSVQRRSEDLDRCAERIAARRTQQIQDGVERIGKGQGTLLGGQGTLLGGQGTLLEGQEQLLGTAAQTAHDVRLVREDVQHMAASASQSLEKLLSANQEAGACIQTLGEERQLINAAIEAHNATLAFLADTVNHMHWQQQLLAEQVIQNTDMHARAPSPMPPPGGGGGGGGGGPRTDNLLHFWPHRVFEELGLPWDLANNDLQEALGRRAHFGRSDHQQASSALATRAFRAWMASRQSPFLLVDGNNSAAARHSLSPMSLLCGTLAAGLERLYGPAGICLHFFCGLHTARGDAASGPRGMLRSLLLQLAMARFTPEADLVFGQGDRYAFWDHLCDHRVDTLCFALGGLLQQLPPGTTVFCLVDGLTALEQDAFHDDLACAVHALRQLAADRRRPAAFKVLLTCPYRSIFLVPRGLVDRRDCVVLEGGAGRGGRSQITDAAVGGYLAC